MIRRCILWLLLPCFIISAALAQKPSPISSQGTTGAERASLLLGTVSGEDDSLSLASLLEECLEFFGELPKSKKSKASVAKSFKLSQFVSASEPGFEAVAYSVLVEKQVVACYQPQDFYPSDYHSYLFRLTPF
ncbi:hypothetical protein [Sabulibacter ruber]|uniref:hypothetical protein n=1 Tax=Sabulibacter ruber TaxID=2811901 RepID=UPI001A95F3E6|nr:hypothetical protein [Sabulibacter ruber]